MAHDDRYLPARQVWERYGVTEMTLYRWIRRKDMSFPEPCYFGRYRYWRVADLIAWESRAPRGRARSETA